MYFNNAAVASWIDPTPYTNGNAISFRSGNCKFSVDEIKVYRSRGNTVGINVGNGLANEMRYKNQNPTQFAGKIKSICQDTAGNLSAIDTENINIDWTPPSNIAFVNDGPTADITVVNTTDSLRANWGNSLDTNSAIARYWYSIGTTAGAINTLGWTNNWGATAVTAKTLTLVQNTIYYFNIKAENGAGLFSSVISSNGQKVDTTSTVEIKENANVIGLQVYPNPFTNQLNFKLQNATASKVKISIIDVLGREVLVTESKEEKGLLNQTLNTGNIANGTYFLKINIDGNLYYKKLVKE